MKGLLTFIGGAALAAAAWGADDPGARALQQHQLQRQQQQELHYRQGIEPGSAQPSEGEGTSKAKAQMELEKAQQQSQQQLRRFESELQVKPGAATDLPRKLD